MTKIAIQGVHGCFHEQAARLFYGNEIGVCECLSFEDLFVALDQGKASGAIMAIENTVAGGLLPNYSLLHKHSRKVKGEVFLRIQQNLMALPGQTIEEITEVHSHYMAIAHPFGRIGRYSQKCCRYNAERTKTDRCDCF